MNQQPSDFNRNIKGSIPAVTSDDLHNDTGYAMYKSTNSDLLSWIIERVSGKPLSAHLLDTVEAAGIEANVHITCDREQVPLVDGGACLTARDLARFGLLFARYGEGVDARQVGDADFIENCRRNPGPPMPAPRE